MRPDLHAILDNVQNKSFRNPHSFDDLAPNFNIRPRLRLLLQETTQGKPSQSSANKPSNDISLHRVRHLLPKLRGKRRGHRAALFQSAHLSLGMHRQVDKNQPEMPHLQAHPGVISIKIIL